MHNLSLLQDLFVIWISALIAGQLFLRLRLPPIAGYMMAGIAVGPNGLKLITDQEQIHVLAEFGVAMLLFALGVDLSLKQLKASAGKLILAGTSQLFLTVLATALTAMALHLADSPGQAFLFGCVCAISSSVVISKILFDRGESDSVHGRILLSMAILQDLSLVLIIPFMPILAAHGNTSWGSILISAMKAIGFTALIFFGAMRALPSILAGVARSNSRELFLLTLLGLCLGIALLSHQVGLSIALGAFLAGIMISESLYAHQALHDVQPLKDLFSVVFFVSVGMLLDPAFIFSHCLEVVLFVILLISGKTVLAAISALFATANVRSALMVGAGMAQIGEFSFILLSMGRDLKMINDYMYNLFFAGAVESLIASPALF
ncbi:MAG TPA: cation:proton antiporter, partial [Candidatus Obscuribacter sp.]|nr:cation:proton antiporter [Candidatus Obscuribacter sp.]